MAFVCWALRESGTDRREGQGGLKIVGQVSEAQRLIGDKRHGIRDSLHVPQYLYYLDFHLWIWTVAGRATAKA